MNSPNCVRVLGHESFEEGPGIILELIEGVTLFELGQRFHLSDEEISQLGSQVCLGLRAIEAAGDWPKNMPKMALDQSIRA